MIKVQDLVMDNFTEEQIAYLISHCNYAILDSVVSIIANGKVTELNIEQALEWFVTALYVTYSSDEIVEQLECVEADSNELLERLGQNDNFIIEAAYELGTNSEMPQNYSVLERIILLLAVAKKCDIKFDFSWNL